MLILPYRSATIPVPVRPASKWAMSLRSSQPAPAHAEAIDRACTPMVEAMNTNGIGLDTQYLHNLDLQVLSKLAVVNEQITTCLGHGRPLSTRSCAISPSSPQQVSQLMLDMKIEPPTGYRYGKGVLPSSDDDTLRAIKDTHPVWDLILTHRQLSKLTSTYTGKLGSLIGADGRIRTRFGYVTARTGRFNSDSPNLQNIPADSVWGKLVRDAFRASPGYTFVGGDLSQIEMVWAAELSQDPVMREIFHEGQDQHVRTAYGVFKDPATGLLPLYTPAPTSITPVTPVPVFNWDYPTLSAMWKAYDKNEGQLSDGTQLDALTVSVLKHFKHTVRLPSKTLGFATLYGTTPSGLQTQILSAGGPLVSVETCASYIHAFFDLYEGIRRMMDELHSNVMRFGLVWGGFGRVRYIPEGQSSITRLRAAAMRQAGNAPLQGSAGDHLKLVMACIWPILLDWQEAGIDVRPLLTIHDELIFEVPIGWEREWAEELKMAMEHTVELSVPVKAGVSIGDQWGDLK